ncbi:MAG: isomerase, partial [Marivirga sp.]|nr:isomerase [Marivirga sp.]
PLTVKRDQDLLILNFPADVLENVEVTQELINCFALKPVSAFRGKTDYMLVFEDQRQIMSLQPSYPDILKLQARGVIATAIGDEVDFVSRFFAPQSGINEDPVTGSAHTTLTPYWAKQLNKTEMTALQLSARRGLLKCKYLDDRVEISGYAKEYLVGEIFLE